MGRSTNDWDNIDDDFEDDDSQTNVPDLRKAYNKEKRERKALEDKLNSLLAEQRQRSVKDVLASKGLNTEIAELIPNTITEESDVIAWIESKAKLFGIQIQTDTDSSQETQAVPDSNLQAINQIANTQAGGSPFSGDAKQMEALIAAARTPAELNQLLFGNPSGPARV